MRYIAIEKLRRDYGGIYVPSSGMLGKDHHPGPHRYLPGHAKESIVQGVVIIDESGAVLEFSQSALEVLSCRYDELLGSDIADFMPADQASALRAAQAAEAFDPVRGGEGHIGEIPSHSPDGTPCQVGVTMIRLLSRGRPRYAVALQEVRQRYSSGEIVRAVPETNPLLQANELDLFRQLVQSLETKLTRVTLEIHDTLVQDMSNAIHMLNAFETSENMNTYQGDQLAGILILLRQGVRNARAIGRDLMPVSLDRLGLAKILQFELENLAMLGVVSTFSFDTPDFLSREVETATFRIASEAILNVKKHAKANTATISIATENNTMTMIIQDDGLGFDTVNIDRIAQHEGMGLGTMHARAGLMGGTFHLVSTPGQGTMITVKLPLTGL